METRDAARDPNTRIIWYQPLSPNWNILSQRFQFNPLGIHLTRFALRILEFIRLAPAGTVKVQTMLQQGAVGVRIGGEKEVFTPMFLLVGRKPAHKK